MRRWERARQGDGQLVLIVGEPGIGKSRLVEEFYARLRDTPHTLVGWSCSQLLQNTPLHPIAEWGRQCFGGEEIPAERRLADLENTLRLPSASLPAHPSTTSETDMHFGRSAGPFKQTIVASRQSKVPWGAAAQSREALRSSSRQRLALMAWRLCRSHRRR